MDISLSSDPENGGGPSGGSGPERNHERRRRAGTLLGALMLRYSSIHVLGSAVAVVLTFVGSAVITHFLVPAEFGRLALGLFLASLLSFLFSLVAKPGTMRRVFGVSGDDDEEGGGDEEEERALTQDPARSLGTGIALTAIIGLAGTAIVFALATPIADVLLGSTRHDGRGIVVWAAVAGFCASLYRLAVLALWMERRPLMYVGLVGVYALVTPAAAVALVAADMGVEGALAGTAAGTLSTGLIALIALRPSFDVAFDPREALIIMRRGVGRVPIIGSAWLFGYSSTFIVSRFVSHADLGIFHFAARAGVMAAYFATGFRMALRPLKRTTTFAAVEEEYGFAEARGIQVRYFLLMVIGALLAATLFADVIVRAAPSSYEEAASLIPLMAAGLAGPIVFRVLSRSTRFPSKTVVFRVSVIGAAPVFIGLALLLVPWLGVEGAPLAMIATFAGPIAYLLYRSQHDRNPIAMPWRALALALALAMTSGGAYYAIAPDDPWLQAATAAGLFAAWLGLLLVTGVIPRGHRLPLRRIGRGALRRRASAFDAEAALQSLGRRDRAMLHEAIVQGRPLEEIAADLGREEMSASKRIVRGLRRAATGGGDQVAEATKNDAEIGEYLFFTADRPSARDATMKRLLREYRVAASDLHELEAVVAALRAAPAELWQNDRAPATRPSSGGA